MADKITELHQEESLAVLKDISDKLSQTGNAELFKHIEMIKGDKGDSGIGIKSIDSKTLDKSVVIRIEKTDGELVSVEVERLKGIDGNDGKDGVDGAPGKKGIDGAPGKAGKPGERGLIGKTGQKGRDGKSFVWRGLWKPNTTYSVNDVVEFYGSSYICVNNAVTSAPSFSKNGWEMMAQKGKDGVVSGSAGDTTGTGGVQSVVAGTNVTVDSTDPANPIVSASGGGGSGTSLPADSAAGWLHDNGSGTLAWSTPSKSDVGLSNVNNTADTAKPVSTAQQTALNAKADTSSLAPVATSGSYTDLTSKPTIPATFDDLTDGTTNKAYTTTEKTKLAAITGTNTGDQDLSGLVPTTTTVNGHALSANVTVSKGDVGLGSVTNDAQLKAADLDTDTTLASDSDTKVASQHAVKSYVDTSVTGLLDFKGSTNASANPNYPAALKGDTYVVSVAGKVGGASGKSVDVGDMYLATANNAGGTEASVGTSWSVLEHNLVGALLAGNNLSDISSASTARTNLGLGNVVNLDTSTTANITDSTNKRLITDAQQTVLSNTSGTNTGDQTSVSGNAGTATRLSTARNIAGVAFDGSGNISLASTNLSDTASIVLLTSTQTLSNKRNTPRVGTTASSATPTINTDNVDIYTITAQAAAITSFTTNLSGTPNNGDKLIISITDNGTSRAITWGASFESSTIILPTATVVSTRLDVAFIWNVATSKWRCIGVA